MWNVPLRTRVILLTALLGLVAVTASASLVLLSTWLHVATLELGDAVENVHVADQGVQDLLLLARAKDPVLAAELQGELRRDLDAGRGRVTTVEGAATLARARGAVDAYLLEGADDLASFDGAYTALRDVAEVHVARARELRRSAQRWEHMAEIIGTLCNVAVPTILLLLLGGLERWLRPVLHLRTAMERHAAGDVDARAPVTGPAELREMAQRFNDLADVARRHRATQVAFLAGVAHDLRNPLLALRLASATARNGQADPARLLEIAGRQVDHLDRMIGDLLDLARVHAGKLTLDVAVHDLRQVVSEVVDLFAASGTPHLELSVPDEPVLARCDAMRVGQVLTNLVSNALKYSPAGACVVVGLEVVDAKVRLAVTDQGRGIGAEELEAVFEPFRRGHDAGPSVAGAGMGLYVARRIVEEHGGCIHVESEPGLGSTFTVELPRASRHDGLSRRRTLTPVPVERRPDPVA